MNYTFCADLLRELEAPKKGILSSVLHKDERANITLFAFSAGEELSAHSAPTPATLHFLEGEGELQLGADKMQVQAGSFAYMPPMLSHAITAKTPLKMLLVQNKAVAG